MLAYQAKLLKVWQKSGDLDLIPVNTLIFIYVSALRLELEHLVEGATGLDLNVV